MEMNEPEQFTYTGVSRPCFCCGKMLHEDYPERPHNPLHANWLGATDWTSYGNWCSSKLDCGVDTEYKIAHIVICDECFEERKDRIHKVQYTTEERARMEEEQRQNLIKLRKLLIDEKNKED
jgi:hypothetical protein